MGTKVGMGWLPAQGCVAAGRVRHTLPRTTHSLACIPAPTAVTSRRAHIHHARCTAPSKPGAPSNWHPLGEEGAFPLFPK